MSVICITALIVVLDSPDIAALAVLASVASAAVGGVAGMVSPRQQGPNPASKETKPPAAARPSAADSE